MFERIFNICKEKERIETEEYLFEFSYNYLHLMSLLWSKSKRKYTVDYCAFLTRKCLGAMFGAFINTEVPIEKVEEMLLDYVQQNKEILKAYDADYVIINMGIEFVTDVVQTDVVLKMATLFAILEHKLNLSITDIIDGYSDY